MIQKYRFSDGIVEFEDSRTVRELIEFAFNQFDYYEPFGIEIVTLYQCHHPKSNYGWFTTDKEKSCAEEIIGDRDWLCFAYHIPGVLYFAEGGWGHHMEHLGNHPEIIQPVSLNIRTKDFDHTIVIAGKYTFRDIITALKSKEYIPYDSNALVIRGVNPYQDPYPVFFTSPDMDLNLVQFKERLPESSAVVIIDICTL